MREVFVFLILELIIFKNVYMQRFLQACKHHTLPPPLSLEQMSSALLDRWYGVKTTKKFKIHFLFQSIVLGGLAIMLYFIIKKQNSVQVIVFLSKPISFLHVSLFFSICIIFHVCFLFSPFFLNSIKLFVWHFFKSYNLCNPMLQTLDISSYEFCLHKIISV